MPRNIWQQRRDHVGESLRDSQFPVSERHGYEGPAGQNPHFFIQRQRQLSIRAFLFFHGTWRHAHRRGDN